MQTLGNVCLVNITNSPFTRSRVDRGTDEDAAYGAKNNPGKGKSSSVESMGRTIGIAVGCAAAYIVLVVGLMIYCKGRRARQSKKEEIMAPECENCKCLSLPTC